MMKDIDYLREKEKLNLNLFNQVKISKFILLEIILAWISQYNHHKESSSFNNKRKEFK